KKISQRSKTPKSSLIMMLTRLLMFCFIVEMSEGWFFFKPKHYSGHWCEFHGYNGGQSKVTVSKITAPVATMEKKVINDLAGNMGTAASIGKDAVDIIKGVGYLTDIAGKLSPALAIFSSAFGFVDSFLKPSPQDILDKANKAIKQLTDEVNDRLDQMKDYISHEVITL
uniref:Uncharacterized protein n=1 Tax=Clytia hemisphaerica TaxID=252671 RepID=A0A7M5X8I6_9CNID